MLTETVVKAAKALEKPRKLYDERGLFVLINPNGSRLWRVKHQFEGREKVAFPRRLPGRWIEARA